MSDRSTSVLIVGCGYLGLQVSRLLLAQGKHVIGTTRSAYRAEELQAEGIEPLLLDLDEVGSSNQLPAAEQILWCVGFDGDDGVWTSDVYVERMRRFLERLPAHGGRFVYTSSTGVYGQADGEWVDENSPTEPRNRSARSCLVAEQLLAGFGAGSAWSTVTLRLAGLYGPGRLMRRIHVERGEGVPGDPGHWLNLVHVSDAARVAAHALSKPTPSNLYNVCDDHPVERRDFYLELARVLNAPEPRFEQVQWMREGRDSVNKRVSNGRLRAEVAVDWAYPDYLTGIRASLDDWYDPM